MHATSSSPVLAELVNFTWERAASAEWVPREAHKRRFDPAGVEAWRKQAPVAEANHLENVWLLCEPATGLTARYEPLRERPELFRTFACLDGDAAYLSFAQEYGALRTPPYGPSNSLAFWMYEVQTMRTAVRLWEALKSGKAEEGLAEGAWEEEVVVDAIDGEPVTGELTYRTYTLRRDVDADTYQAYCGEPSPFDIYLERQSRSTLFPTEHPRSPRQAARLLLRSTISDALSRHELIPQLDLDDKVYGAGLRLTFEVTSLIAALWLQFALAVDGNRDYRKCPVCGNWWDATNARSHKLVCSDKCRAKKSYQSRQAAKRGDGGKGGAS
jgi:hypothetical protein